MDAIELWAMTQNHAIFTRGPVCGVIWRGKTTSDAIQEFRDRCLSQIKRYPDGIAVIGIVEGTAEIPATNERRLSSETNQQLLEAGVRCFGALMPTTGLLAGWARATASAIMHLSKDRYSIKVFKTSADCCQWCYSTLRSQADAEACAAEIDAIRERHRQYCQT